jgi:hypothetical protein
MDEMKTDVSDVHEGSTTRAIEHVTAKVPSLGYLGLAVASIGISAFTTAVLGKKTLGNFFGLWAPTFLLIGVYNKLVKMEGSMERQLMH